MLNKIPNTSTNPPKVPGVEEGEGLSWEWKPAFDIF